MALLIAACQRSAAVESPAASPSPLTDTRATATLPADRWESYLKLQRELAHLERKLDPRLRSEERKRWAAFSKSQRQRMKVINKKR